MVHLSTISYINLNRKIVNYLFSKLYGTFVNYFLHKSWTGRLSTIFQSCMVHLSTISYIKAEQENCQLFSQAVWHICQLFLIWKLNGKIVNYFLKLYWTFVNYFIHESWTVRLSTIFWSCMGHLSTISYIKAEQENCQLFSEAVWYICQLFHT